ncbi:MAG: type II secretion system F family protein [Chloroflexi bacterium]|nr:type II secretion system F family protein [Chloroflexota bacterium]
MLIDTNIWISSFFALGIALLFLGLDLIVSGRARDVQNRLSAYAPTENKPEKDQAVTGLKRKGAATRWGRDIQTELARADLPVTVSEYLLANVLLSALGFLIGLVLLGHPLLGLTGLLAGLFAPRWYLRYLQAKRIEAFNGGLEGALVMLANVMRSGSGLSQAMESVSREVAPPISTEFARVVREVGLGLPIHEALDNLLRRNPSLDLDLTITAIKVNHEVGGNLAEILDRIASTIRERVKLAGEVRALTAQQRFSAVILTLLPVAVSLIVFILNPTYISALWQSVCGFLMLGAGALLMLTGMIAIKRILAFRF